MTDAVVLFGAGGFIGRNLVEALRGRVRHLFGVTAGGRAVEGCELTVRAADLAALPPLPRRTAIFHVAAHRYRATRFAAEQANILTANLGLTDLVYRFARERDIREIRAASSAAVYPAEWAVLEDSRPLDLNAWPHDGEAAYAWSKRWGEIAAELWHRHAGINTISFRLTSPYGRFDTLDAAEAHVATAFAIRALDHAPEFIVAGDPEAERDFVFAADVAAAFVASLSLSGVQTAVNCAFGQTTRIAALAQAAMRAAGCERPLRTDPALGNRGGAVKIRRATAARLRGLLPELPDFRPLDDGMRETVAWYRDALG
jgi:nucleoside-diphosphate-sugar epimerase